MTEELRRTNARAAASRYAPPPDGSHLTYGSVAAAAAGVAVFFVGLFFGVDMLTQPLTLLGYAVAAFAAGMAGHHWQSRRFARAYVRELAEREALGDRET